MTDLPKLTILLGPQTRMAFALNAHIRENRPYLTGKGMTVLPSRLASPLVRRALDGRPLDERKAEFDEAVKNQPAVLAAINLLGPPHAGLVKGELFPDAEVSLAGLDPIIGDARIVMAIEPLPAFFLAAPSDPLEDRVRRTPWEVLYELSWFELLSELVELLPVASFLVVTGARQSLDVAALSRRLLGDESERVPQPYILLRHLISETGHAVLDRMVERGTPDAETLTDLYQSFAVRPTLLDLRDRLGIDKTTAILLEQRFEEDLENIAKLPRVEVL